MPVRGVLGTDYLTVRPDFKVMRNPYGPDDLVVVPAINPDFAIFHAFRADPEGNVVTDHEQNCWLIAQAARQVIVTVEEIVDQKDFIRESFGAIVSNIHIDAIVLAPRGAHPTSVKGYYPSDRAHVHEYLRHAHSDEEFEQYLDRYVRCDERQYSEQVAIAGEGASA